MEIKYLLELDDSCQQMLYAKGHHDRDEFLAACRRTIDFAVINDEDPVNLCYLRWRPLRGNIVSDRAADFTDKGRGATPVTVLDVWLPLSHRDQYHERCIQKAHTGEEGA